MDIIIYILGVLFGLLFFWVAEKNESFPAAYLATACFLFMGLAIFQFGIDINTGASIVESGATTIVTDTYTNYIPLNNWIVSLIAYTFLLGGFVSVVGTTFYAFKG